MKCKFIHILACVCLLLALVYLLKGVNFRGDGTDVLVEAESFDDIGGWVVDQQVMDQMGSPYLLAHGLGKVVDEARTEVEFSEVGKYRV